MPQLEEDEQVLYSLCMEILTESLQDPEALSLPRVKSHLTALGYTDLRVVRHIYRICRLLYTDYQEHKAKKPPPKEK